MTLKTKGTALVLMVWNIYCIGNSTFYSNETETFNVKEEGQSLPQGSVWKCLISDSTHQTITAHDIAEATNPGLHREITQWHRWVRFSIFMPWKTPWRSYIKKTGFCFSSFFKSCVYGLVCMHGLLAQCLFSDGKSILYRSTQHTPAAAKRDGRLQSQGHCPAEFSYL